MKKGLSLLVVTGGHPVEFVEFSAMFDHLCDAHGWRWQHVAHPDALDLLTPGNVGRWDAIVLHDIAGLSLARGQAPAPIGPSDDVKRNLTELLLAGQGIVVTHHSLASWPQWDEWAHAIGGRYFYAPGSLDGQQWPSSGYRIDRHHIRVLDAKHPVCDGVSDFDIDDELYLCPIFESEVVPLLATIADCAPEKMVSTYEMVLEGVTVSCDGHPTTSPLVAWAKAAGRSPLVYLQPGHGPATFKHEMYGRLLGNAVAWVSSSEAHSWAQGVGL